MQIFSVKQAKTLGIICHPCIVSLGSQPMILSIKEKVDWLQCNCSPVHVMKCLAQDKYEVVNANTL